METKQNLDNSNSMAESDTREGGVLTGVEGNEMKLSRKEKKKLAKKKRRKEKRKEVAENEREEEEARANDTEEQRRLEMMEKEEEEMRERALKEFEERERIWMEQLELKQEEERRKTLEQQQQQEEEEEEAKKKQLQVEKENECDEDDDWEYVEEGPAEIIWQGNEIIIRKKKVKVPKKDANQLSEKENADRPTSNPLPPQSEAFADYQSVQQALETVAREVPNFGTEQDKAHCPFHLKTGACRFGQRCSRVHFYPDKSCTLLIKNMYNGPGLAWEQDEGLEYTDEEVERSYEEFYEDVHTEFLKFGEIVNFKVCKNGSFHLRGNVYVHYKLLESAVDAYHSINGRYFAGKQVKCEFINVTRWKLAICGEYMKSRLRTCSHGTACNFIHCFRNPGGDYEWADWDKPPPKYWVKKMVALFGYSHDSGYQKQMEQDYLGQTRNSNKINTSDADRYQSRRSKSREMNHVKSSSRRSCDAEHNDWEESRSKRYTDDRRKRIKHLDERFREESTKFKDYHRNEGRSDETNSDGSWSDMNKDRDRDRVVSDRHHSHKRKSIKHRSYGDAKNRTDESDSDWSCSDGERDKKICHVHTTKRSSTYINREVLDENGNNENKTFEAHGGAQERNSDRERDHSHTRKRSRDRSKVGFLENHGDNKIRDDTESTREWSDRNRDTDRHKRHKRKSSGDQSDVSKFQEDDLVGMYRTSDSDSVDDCSDRYKERHHSHGRKRSRKHKHSGRRSHSRKADYKRLKSNEVHESSSSGQYDGSCKSIDKHDPWVSPEGDQKSRRKHTGIQSYESGSPGRYDGRSKSQDPSSEYCYNEKIDGGHLGPKEDSYEKHTSRSKSSQDDQDPYRGK